MQWSIRQKTLTENTQFSCLQCPDCKTVYTLASSVAMWRHICRCVPHACPPADRVTDAAPDADVRAVETRCGGPPHRMCGRPRFDLGVHSWSPFSIAMSWQRTADHVADAALDAGVRAVDAALVPGPQRQAGL